MPTGSIEHVRVAYIFPSVPLFERSSAWMHVCVQVGGEEECPLHLVQFQEPDDPLTCTLAM
jgi:hypothetical protein